ncbi:MAG: isoprenylcysteine carboxylmethyltransferase family protein [Alphaproteobacteria bacterium]|nr:isoprenylcysteine carboxylmethyltransferase family protein [Alphaproteobacteria bacterium]MDE2110407.1 isoprenylcysteine carboxylmethyltransferase family protein [Alphaproteobacteria bacterium]MDE2493434.1 isoprenylcysteine carboxylmethyltransferase family protein [Alphaproteobacteria bacterium]
MTPQHALYLLWIGWYATWLASLAWTGRAKTRPDFRKQGPYQFATLTGLFLLFGPPITGLQVPRMWALTATETWALFALIFCSFAFCWWARIEMGRLWSGLIALSADHRVIDTGPFALVRHPIYSGIIFAAFMTAFAQGTVTGLAGAGMLWLAFWMKARLEEVFLRTELGATAYDGYRRRVPMLVPFWPKGA